MTTKFVAKYPSQCVWCLEPIDVGQDACYWRQKLHHYECKQEAYAETRKEDARTDHADKGVEK